MARETYKQATERLMNALGNEPGWTLHRLNQQMRPLKEPWAENKHAGYVVRFKPQATYIDGRSTPLDRRGLELDALLESVRDWTVMSGSGLVGG